MFTTYRIGSFILIQVKSSALDRIYMMMILLQVIVILHDPDYWPVQLYVLLYEFDSLSICIPTPYPIRCYWWCLLYFYVWLRLCLFHVPIAIMKQEILILCILRISLVVLSISSHHPIIMIIIFQHLNWCSNSCWLLFNNNKQHHRISIPQYIKFSPL